MKASVRLALIVAAAAALGACSTGTRAPVVERLPSGRAAAPKPAGAVPSAQTGEAFYTVKRGDTLYSIALEHGVDYRDVAQWNFLDDPTKLRVGQTLRVKPPEDTLAPGVQVGAAPGAGRLEARPLDSSGPPAPAGARTEPKALRLPYSKENVASLAPKTDVASQASAEASQFIWPVKGKVLAGFSEPRSKGIDIEGKPGQPVLAAAAGRVTYVGSGIPGLGKLVVIKHDNGFITVYAHNRAILVKEQQKVAQGQPIAEVGSSDSDRPKLHFQIRKGASPVDPLKYLPSS